MKMTKYMALAALALAACSPEDFDSVSEANIPTASTANVTVAVDDETNQVTLTLNGAGQYPMWYIPVDGKEVTKNAVYSTTNPFSRIYTSAGDYTVYYRIGNSNGLSQGMGEVNFTIKNSLTNYDELMAKLCGKEWRIANDEAGHLGCGPSGTTGLEWYSAGADDKKAFGLYDDRVTFATDGTYAYNPGDGGTVFVNTGCSIFADYHQDQDFMVPVEKQESSYTFSTEGDAVYLTFPTETLFPYIPADAAYTGELRLRIESLTASKLVLVWDDGSSIAWHYILTSAEAGFQGFTASSDCNLWKGCTFENQFYYAPGWAQIDDPTLEADGNSYTVSLPSATSDQWQAQVKFLTDMTTSADKNYDFSAKFSSATTDITGATVKLVLTGDDNTFYFADRIDLKAGGEYIFYKSDMAGIDMSAVSLVLDFGGAPADTKVNIYDVCLQEHMCDGVEAPAEQEEEDKTVYTYASESNLWKTYVDDKGTDGYTTFFYYAPNWAEISNDGMLSSDGGVYTVSLAEACAGQWQAQVHLKTAIPGEADTEYDFSCKMTAKKDISGVTIKFTDDSNDENYLFANQYDLAAGDEYVVKIPAVTLKKGAAENMKLVFDFGNTPADESVEISEIILQKTAK